MNKTIETKVESILELMYFQNTNPIIKNTAFITLIYGGK